MKLGKARLLYQEGYDAGYAKAKAQLEAELDRVTKSLVEMNEVSIRKNEKYEQLEDERAALKEKVEELENRLDFIGKRLWAMILEGGE